MPKEVCNRPTSARFGSCRQEPEAPALPVTERLQGTDLVPIWVTGTNWTSCGLTSGPARRLVKRKLSSFKLQRPSQPVR